MWFIFSFCIKFRQLYNANLRSAVVMLRSIWYILGVTCLFNFGEASDLYEETLVLKPPNDDQLYVVFNFSTVSEDLKSLKNHHYSLFPRVIGELVRKYGIAEFHLSMTQGLWRYERWGHPYYPAPPGAQLWVWFQPEIESVEASWKGFTNALSGLLCASLNFIGKTETVTPTLSFRPQGAIQDASSSLLRYAVLSRETLCTENLTPWLKMLPCGSNSGISSLLNPAALHHSQYLSLGLNYKQKCFEKNCDNPAIQLHQSVSTMFDLRKSTSEKPGFSVSTILNKKIKGPCPLAHRSDIRLSVPEHVSLHPRPSIKENGFSVYNLFDLKALRDIQVQWNNNFDGDEKTTPILVVHCHLAGIGQQEGGVRCRLSNSAARNISVLVMQTVPWFLQVYLHTLQITDQDGKILLPKRVTFRPAKIRQSPHFLEYMLNISPSSTIKIALQFNRGFLTWTEHPPDANHGFYIGSTVVSVREKDIEIMGSDNVHHIYSEALQVFVPVPDFSMPYNVICLACTVLAIAFGSLHNLTTRRYQAFDSDEPKAESFVNKLMSFLKKLIGLVKRDKLIEPGNKDS
uniref:GPI transamidase component PIG-T-like isoform X2 n=1 Tax=Styela clava TaxID=7725 RepID=UPI00193970B5|nr:GPI transamidase component PIG-T-like isoform X2 [Styela clava]